MSSSHAHPSPATPGGASSSGNAPQVVVRAGKTFICTACGTLVEVPADVVEQFVLVPPTEAKPPSRPQPPAEEPTPAKSSPMVETPPEVTRSPESSATTRPNGSAAIADRPAAIKDNSAQAPPRPRRPRRPNAPDRTHLTGQTIDGLVVPSAAKLDRAFSWVSYQFMVLDRKNSEFERLKKLLKKRAPKKSRAPCPEVREQSKPSSADAPVPTASGTTPRDVDPDIDPPNDPTRPRVPVELPQAPKGNDAHQRGPP